MPHLDLILHVYLIPCGSSLGCAVDQESQTLEFRCRALGSKCQMENGSLTSGDSRNAMDGFRSNDRGSRCRSITNRYSIRQLPVHARCKSLSPLPSLQRHRQGRQLASTAEAFLELGDTEKFCCTRINLCFAGSKHFAVPFWGFDVLLFLGKRGPEPFHRLETFSLAQAQDFFFQFSDAHCAQSYQPRCTCSR